MGKSFLPSFGESFGNIIERVTHNSVALALGYLLHLGEPETPCNLSPTRAIFVWSTGRISLDVFLEVSLLD